MIMKHLFGNIPINIRYTKHPTEAIIEGSALGFALTLGAPIL